MMRKKRLLLFIGLIMVLAFALPCGVSAAGNDNDFSAYQNYSDESICISTMKDIGMNDDSFILTGETIAPDDIVIFNDKIAIGIACGTNDPWGYPAGSVLDVATLDVADHEGMTLADAAKAGKIQSGYDRVWDIQFLMNNWDSWAPSNAGTVKYEVIRYDFDTDTEYPITAETGLPTLKLSKVYKVIGNFDVVTYYSMAAGADFAYMRTYVENKSDEEIASLNCGYSLTHEGDFNDCTFSCGSNAVSDKPYHHYTSAYTEESAVTIAVPGDVTRVGTSATSGYQDLYCVTAFGPAGSDTASKYYNGVILMQDKGDTTGVIDYMMDEYGVEQSDRLTVKGKADVENPVVTVKRNYNGKSMTMCWTQGAADGSFEVTLPPLAEGETYELFAEKYGCSPSEVQTVGEADFEGNVAVTDDFALVKKVPAEFKVKDQNGNDLFAKVAVTGMTPSVRYTGEAVFLSEEPGKIEALVPQGDYTATVYAEGFNFYGQPVSVSANSADAVVEVTANQEFALPEGYLSADVHHHSKKNDGYSTPENVILSQLISGLQVGVISDHDFTSENMPAYEFIKANDFPMAFYPSVEISCSWAHFNVLPQTEEAYDKLLNGAVRFDQFADYNDIVDSVHEIGGSITQNHPYITYGLAYADKYGTIPGKYEEDGETISPEFDYDAYDNVELNGAIWPYGAAYDNYYNGPVLKDAMNDWSAFLAGNEEKEHYFVGGSDVHDVLADNGFHTGNSRTVVYLGDTSDLDRVETGLLFAQEAKAGHSYVTAGPILDADKLFGETFVVEDSFGFTLDISAVNKIASITVYTNDGESYKVADEVSLGDDKTYTYTFDSGTLEQGSSQWYCVRVNAVGGRYAITNPYWVYCDKEVADLIKAIDEIGEATIDEGNLIMEALAAYDNLSPEQQALVSNYDVLEAAAEEWSILFMEVNNPFEDVVRDDYFFVPVVWANYIHNPQITNGTDATHFSPAKTCSRGEVVTFLWRAMGGPQPTTKENPFSDVSKDDYFYTAVLWAVENDITTGTGGGKFSPKGDCTRGQVVTFLWRAEGEPEPTTTENPFSDVPSGQYYEKAVLWAVEEGITGGTGGGKFSPAKTCSRGEIVTFLYRDLAE